MKILSNVIFVVLLTALSAFVLYWTEAKKEVEILCSMFNEGETAEYVTKTLDTGNLLEYTRSGRTLIASSRYNLSSDECKVEFSADDIILNATYTEYFDLAKALVWIGLLLSSLLGIFQLLLALGYPLGKYAWGGEHKILPKSLRIGSFFSMMIFAFTVFLLLMYLTGQHWLPEAYPVLGIMFLISSLANFNSKSTPEKRIMTPIAILLYLCFLNLSLI